MFPFESLSLFDGSTNSLPSLSPPLFKSKYFVVLTKLSHNPGGSVASEAGDQKSCTASAEGCPKHFLSFCMQTSATALPSELLTKKSQWHIEMNLFHPVLNYLSALLLSPCASINGCFPLVHKLSIRNQL